MTEVMPVFSVYTLQKWRTQGGLHCLLVYPCRNSAHQLAAPNVSASAVSAEKVLKL